MTMQLIYLYLKKSTGMGFNRSLNDELQLHVASKHSLARQHDIARWLTDGIDQG